jgi:hypothetical protein
MSPLRQMSNARDVAGRNLPEFLSYMYSCTARGTVLACKYAAEWGRDVAPERHGGVEVFNT